MLRRHELFPTQTTGLTPSKVCFLFRAHESQRGRYDKGIWFIKEAIRDRAGLLSSGSTLPIGGERLQDLQDHQALRLTQAPTYLCFHTGRVKQFTEGEGLHFNCVFLSSAGVVAVTQGRPGLLRKRAVVFLLSCPPTRRSEEEVGCLSLPRESGRGSPLLGGPPPSHVPRPCGQRDRSAA